MSKFVDYVRECWSLLVIHTAAIFIVLFLLTTSSDPEPQKHHILLEHFFAAPYFVWVGLPVIHLGVNVTYTLYTGKCGPDSGPAHFLAGVLSGVVGFIVGGAFTACMGMVAQFFASFVFCCLGVLMLTVLSIWEADTSGEDVPRI